MQPLPTASTNAGQTNFTKIEGLYARTQPLFANISAFVAAYGQYAFTPLLVSEQCSYGGRFLRDAFDPSQILGDHCWAVLGELRYDSPDAVEAAHAGCRLTLSRITARPTTSTPPWARPCRRAAPRSAAACAPHGKTPTRLTSRSRRRSKDRGATTGAPSSSSARSIRENGTNERLRHLLLISTALMPLAAALAGPNGGVVVGGSAQINNPGTANVTINQFSDKAIINWHMFNIGVGEKTTFVQPNANSVALNRVVGGMGPSEILGSLNANGKVFVVNKDGIIFGARAVINTAGFLATTSDIRNEDFMAGRFNFNIPGRPDASIVNMGTITATNGGFAALVAPGVRNPAPSRRTSAR